MSNYISTETSVDTTSLLKALRGEGVGRVFIHFQM